MSKLDPNNPYTELQKSYYCNEAQAKKMAEVDHQHHNDNPDYWDYLLGLVKKNPAKWRGAKALDVGCGTGRNIHNLFELAEFERVDGVDMSKPNLDQATRLLEEKGHENIKDFLLYVSNGVDLDVLPENEYDFVCSTIVFQHICVHSIRHAMMQDIARALKKGGVFSCQMGFGEGYGKTPYSEDELDAEGTNTKHDVFMVEEDILTLKKELKKMGFVRFKYSIRPSFSDGHPNWIFFTAHKRK